MYIGVKLVIDFSHLSMVQIWLHKSFLDVLLFNRDCDDTRNENCGHILFCSHTLLRETIMS